MMQKKERNNKGFTLVELLVAISVLALIVVPFMQAFVTAARTNRKAEKMQSATTVASNVMEELKANTIEDFAFQFNYPVNTSTGASRFDVMNTFTNAYELAAGAGGSMNTVVQYEENAGTNNESDVTASVLYKDYEAQTTEEFEFLGQDSGRYYFVLEGVTVEDHTFDTLITLNANTYVDPYTVGYNEMKVPLISTPDELSDAFYIQENTMDNDIGEKFLVTYNSSTKAIGVRDLYDGSYDNDEVGRQIEIDVEKAGEVTKVNITFTYTYYTKTDGAVQAVGTKVVEDLMYNNAEGQSQELRSLYLFYKPLYGSKLSRGIDKIKIHNLDNLPLNIYIVKQRQSTVDSVAMSVKEAEYYCELELQDTSGINVGSRERSCMTIRTNLGENLYRENVTLDNQYVLRYSTNASRNPEYSPNNKAVLGVTGLNGEEEKDRIYDVTVSVYEEGQAADGFEDEAFIEITGSKSN